MATFFRTLTSFSSSSSMVCHGPFLPPKITQFIRTYSHHLPSTAASTLTRSVSLSLSSSFRSLSSPSCVQSVAKPFNYYQNGLLVIPNGAGTVRSMSMKTKSSVKKRFRVNGGGNIIRIKSGRRHLNMHKTRSRVNSLGQKGSITKGNIRKRYLKLLGLSPLSGR